MVHQTLHETHMERYEIEPLLPGRNKTQTITEYMLCIVQRTVCGVLVMSIRRSSAYRHTTDYL
jgi:hypothetical protein